MRRRRTLFGERYECSDRLCRDADEVTARWVASPLKPPSK